MIPQRLADTARWLDGPARSKRCANNTRANTMSYEAEHEVQ